MGSINLLHRGKIVPLFAKITSSSISADKVVFHLLQPKRQEFIRNIKTQPSGSVTASMQNVNSFYFCSSRPGNMVDGETAAPIFYTEYNKIVMS